MLRPHSHSASRTSPWAATQCCTHLASVEVVMALPSSSMRNLMVISTLGVTVPAWALPPSPVRTRAMIGPAPVAPAMTWQPLSGVTAPAAPTTPLRLLEPAPAASQAATLAFKVSMYLASGAQNGMCGYPSCTKAIGRLVAIEFDTWNNLNLHDPKQGVSRWWINATDFTGYNDNHVAIFATGHAHGTSNNHASPNHFAATPSIPNLADGKIHEVKIKYWPQN